MSSQYTNGYGGVVDARLCVRCPKHQILPKIILKIDGKFFGADMPKILKVACFKTSSVGIVAWQSKRQAHESARARSLVRVWGMAWCMHHGKVAMSSGATALEACGSGFVALLVSHSGNLISMILRICKRRESYLHVWHPLLTLRIPLAPMRGFLGGFTVWYFAHADTPTRSLLIMRHNSLEL